MFEIMEAQTQDAVIKVIGSVVAAETPSIT